MMSLAEQREARAFARRVVASLESLHQPDLPERLRAIELLGEDAARQVLQLLLTAGRRQRRGANVVLEVEVRVVDPDRPSLVQRHRAQLLPEARHEREPGLDVLQKLGVGRRRAFEDRHRGHVHVRCGVLQMQEGRVQRGEPVSVHGS
jgi:hypothetical protein